MTDAIVLMDRAAAVSGRDAIGFVVTEIGSGVVAGVRAPEGHRAHARAAALSAGARSLHATISVE